MAQYEVKYVVDKVSTRSETMNLDGGMESEAMDKLRRKSDFMEKAHIVIKSIKKL